MRRNGRRGRMPISGPALLPALLSLETPTSASGIYFVDDSMTTPAGSGQVETWGSLRDGTSLVRFYPAASFRALPTVEWTVGFEGDRQAGDRASALFLQAKARLTPEPENPGSVGFALSAGWLVPGERGDGATFVLNGAATLVASARLLLHTNLGVFVPPEGAVPALTWGVRSEAALVPDRLAFHAELFGQSTGRPGFQLGLRPTLAGGRMDLELAFSHNLAGERADWLTLGAAFRF